METLHSRRRVQHQRDEHLALAQTRALLTGFAIKCWGLNNYDQSATGSRGGYRETYTPVDVSGISTATSIGKV